MYIHTCTHIYPNIHAHSYICIHIYMYTHMFLATLPQRNLVPRPLSESSNLAGAFAALVWAWLKRHPTSWGLFHWKIRIKWIINPLGPKIIYSSKFLSINPQITNKTKWFNMQTVCALTQDELPWMTPPSYTRRQTISPSVKKGRGLYHPLI